MSLLMIVVLDEVECKKLVDTAFTSLVQTLPNDQFKDVLDCILQKANLDGQSEERSLKLTAKTETLLHFMWLLLDNCSAGEYIFNILLLRTRRTTYTHELL